jgi:hypothetical protein
LSFETLEDSFYKEGDYKNWTDKSLVDASSFTRMIEINSVFLDEVFTRRTPFYEMVRIMSA